MGFILVFKYQILSSQMGNIFLVDTFFKKRGTFSLFTHLLRKGEYFGVYLSVKLPRIQICFKILSSEKQVGNILGFISVYNYLTNERVADKDLNIEDEITALKFSSQVTSE